MTQRAPVYVASVEHRLEGKIAVLVELDGDLLADQARFVAAAEDEDFDPRFPAGDVEPEAAREFASLEVVGLIHNSHGVGRVGQPNTF